MQKNNGQSVRGTRLIVPDIAAITEQWKALRPAGGFKVVYIDCPWPYENRSPKGMLKNAAMHYPCMAVEDICRLPVHLLAAENCAYFGWNIWPLMPRWDEVITAHGFDFAGLAFEWIKYNSETGKYAFGPGYGTRKNLEPCLLASRGNPHLKKDCPLFGEVNAATEARSVRDFIECWPLDAIRGKRREHSRKPEEARRRIEALFDGPYIELFGREETPGWKVWGNEIDKFTLPETT